jgi:chemotaxis signal transduction protein
VVWRLGELLLAVPLADVEEIAPVDADTRFASSRGAALEVVPPHGVPMAAEPRRAVVVRGGPGVRVALAADDVEGVLPAGAAAGVAPPAWLAGLDLRHVAHLVRLADGRIAAVLMVERLFGPA